MKSKFVDCFVLMSAALSLNNGRKLPEMNRPLIQEIHATTVNISLTIQDLRIIDSTAMILQTTLLLNQRWYDPRLGVDDQRTRRKAVLGQIWNPKITNTNGLLATTTDDEKQNTIFWRGFGDEGSVLLSEKYVLDTHCTMDLRKFPFDWQQCEIKFGTYRFPMEEVMLKWESKPVEILTETDLNGFKLKNVSTHVEVDVRPTGNFTVVVCQIAVRRNSFHYVFCTILPSFLSVLLSYIPFWIDLREHISRFSVNIFSFGYLLYTYYETACSMPAVDYLKALDIFVLICCSFALMSLIETFFVDLLRNINLKGVELKRNELKMVQWIERAFRLSFPIFYVFFVLVFCFYYV